MKIYRGPNSCNPDPRPEAGMVREPSEVSRPSPGARSASVQRRVPNEIGLGERRQLGPVRSLFGVGGRVSSLPMDGQ